MLNYLTGAPVFELAGVGPSTERESARARTVLQLAATAYRPRVWDSWFYYLCNDLHVYSLGVGGHCIDYCSSN